MIQHILSHIPQNHPWKDRIHWFPTIDSTNLELKRMAQQGAPHGSVVIADRQTAGRGRMGRSFLSPGGMGIYMSVLLRPGCPPQQLMHLTCAAAAAMCDAVEEAAGIRPGIKWTNDLVYNQKKLAGILTELGIDPKSSLVDYAIVGIGINCCQNVKDFDPSIQDFAVSLSMCTGKTVDRSAAAASMICTLKKMDRILLTGKKQILDQYRQDCITIGRDISLLRPGCPVQYGRAVDVDDNGSLLVQFADGSQEAVNSGEVSIRGMYGYI